MLDKAAPVYKFGAYSVELSVVYVNLSILV